MVLAATLDGFRQRGIDGNNRRVLGRLNAIHIPGYDSALVMACHGAVSLQLFECYSVAASDERWIFEYHELRQANDYHRSTKCMAIFI